MPSADRAPNRPLGPDSQGRRGRLPERPYPRLVIAAAGSGAGKTSVTAGLLAALAARGTTVAPFKCGPDFLDPQLLRTAARSVSASNLDRWLTSDRAFEAGFRRHALPGRRDVNVIEGVMGVLDTSLWGTSTGDVAARLAAPIVLVVDASRSAESVALEVRGARDLLPGGSLAGVVVNRVGSGWHARAVRQALESAAGVPVVGMLPWSDAVGIPEQRLGLWTPQTRPAPAWNRTLRALGEWVADGVDLDQIVDIARTAPPLPETVAPGPAAPVGAGRCLAVAADPAFCFTYPESLEAFTDRGARIEPFSPVAGQPLPPSADAVYLPGGFPESHAAALARNEGLRRELRQWVDDGRPLLAECGGMMYLLERLVDLNGRSYRMVGAFRGLSAMQARLGGIGYGEARLRRRSLLGSRGQRLRGHVYHHSRRAVPAGRSWAWRYWPRSGGVATDDGLSRGRAVASYLHLRLDAYPRVVEAMLRPGP